MVELYDNLAGSYDMLISWKRRLKRERPFFSHIFKKYRVRRVLDTACGTGIHAIAFHDWGYHVTGTDLSLPMVEKSRENAGDRGIEFTQAGFTELEKTGGMYDAVTCLGNSLPHVLTDEDLDKSLSCMYGAILPGGILVVHGNNYDRILAQKERFMPLTQAKQNGNEHLFLRFFDFHDDLLTFNVISMKKEGGSWKMFPDSSTHRALTRDLLVSRMEKAGFIVREVYGGYPSEHFDELESDNLIVVAQRPHTIASDPVPEPVKAIDRIPVQENGEPVIGILEAVPGIQRMERPAYARAAVVELLRKAEALLPEGYHLRIRVGYRTLEFQQNAYRELYERLSEQHPDWPASQMRREINKFLAPPDAKHPPGHTTGGAIDITIAGPDGEELDMVSSIDPDEDLMALFPTYCKKITPQAAKNRQLLADVMIAVGFSNFPGEWWHYSYGDSAWAVRLKAPHAIYGAAKCDLPDDVLVELNRKKVWK